MKELTVQKVINQLCYSNTPIQKGSPFYYQTCMLRLNPQTHGDNQAVSVLVKPDRLSTLKYFPDTFIYTSLFDSSSQQYEL